MARHTVLRRRPVSSPHTNRSMAAHSDRTDRRPLQQSTRVYTRQPPALTRSSSSHNVPCGKMQCCVVQCLETLGEVLQAHPRPWMCRFVTPVTTHGGCRAAQRPGVAGLKALHTRRGALEGL